MSDRADDPLDLGTLSRLIPLAREGDAAAHNEICRQVQTHLAAMAHHNLDDRLRNKLNPSDIVQQTMTRMIHGFGDFRGATSGEFYSWLNTILRNEIHSTRRDLFRDRRDVRREQTLSTPPSMGDAPLVDSTTPGALALQQEKLQRFRDVIGRLPADYATVVELRGLQEMPFNEIAEKMGRSVNSVTKLYSRALVKLQQELANLDDSIS